MSDERPTLTGRRLGVYQVKEMLGAGGMGQVYRAHDTRLGRDVAIKILPASLAGDVDRLARFEREARVLASLNHPHIAAIYGVEEADGVQALVLEVVEGETLADRLARGRISKASDGLRRPSSGRQTASGFTHEEVLTIARQIADALDGAHEKGIVHRDLKPANIKITPGGVVKVLDFGLAKIGEDAIAPAVDRETATSAGTAFGAILGTPGYMSPEQARGLPVDKRTDIWAFGCVLYELLTSRPAFAGDSFPDILAAIVDREPEWSLLPEVTPQPIRRLLKRCLEKNAARRLRDAADIRIAIDDVLEERGAGGQTADAIAGPRSAWKGAWFVAAVATAAALAAGLAAWAWKPSAVASPLPTARLTVQLPVGDKLGLVSPSVALSPDGQRLAYTAAREGRASQLFVRPIDSLEATLLSGTEGAFAPFFSPDGRWIGFFAHGKLNKVLATGGGLAELCEAAGGFGGTWGTDDSIYFAPLNTSGIWKVSAAGGAAREFTQVNRSQGEVSHRWPQVLPDGKAVLFTVWTGPGWDEKHLELQIGDGGERRVLVRGASTGRYVKSGHVLYGRADGLFVVPFDVESLRVTGPPVTLVDRATELMGEGAQYTVSDTGTLAYIPSDPRAVDRRMVWVAPGGKVEALPAPPGAYTDPAISPDGRFVAVSIQGPTQKIWIYDISRSTLTTLPSAGSSQAPLWTPDGRRLVYRETQAGHRNLFWRAADGSGEEARLTTADTLQTPTTLSRDGTLIFTESSLGSGSDIWMMRLEAGSVPQPVLRTQFSESSAKLSPDGHWIAYTSNESGRAEVYVRPFPNPGGKFAISTNGGFEPRWSHNGRELYYRKGDKTMAVTIANGSTLAPGAPRLLFEGHYQVSDAGGGGYDVAADGRFLMIESTAAEQPATAVNVVLNWFEDVQARVKASAR